MALIENARLRVGAAEAVATAWNENGIPYCVLRGIEGYPESIGRDLDVLVEKESVGEALTIARATLCGLGYRVGVPVNVVWVRKVLGTRGSGWNDSIALDFFTDLNGGVSVS